MPQIECTYSCMNSTANAFRENAARLNNISREVVQIARSLPLNTSAFRRIKKNIVSDLNPQMDCISKSMSKLDDALIIISKAYQSADGKFENSNEAKSEARSGSQNTAAIPNVLTRFLAGIMAIIERMANLSIYSSDDGLYGGDQGSAKDASRKEKRTYYEIYLRNNPNNKLTEKQFQAYLERMNSEGCGYVALVNVIMNKYCGKEEEFEKTFGYPMRDKNGNYNYNYLLVDIYSKLDNYEIDGTYNAYKDYDADEDGSRDSYDLKNDSTGYGTTSDTREYYLKRFLNEYGVENEFDKSVNVTPQNYNDIVKSGKQVIINCGYKIMRKEDGSWTYIAGGHSMTVTGVTNDGKFIVSSWGEKWILDPNETFKIENGRVISSNGKTYETSYAVEGSHFPTWYETADIKV